MWSTSACLFPFPFNMKYWPVARLVRCDSLRFFDEFSPTHYRASCRSVLVGQSTDFSLLWLWCRAFIPRFHRIERLVGAVLAALVAVSTVVGCNCDAAWRSDPPSAPSLLASAESAASVARSRPTVTDLCMALPWPRRVSVSRSSLTTCPACYWSAVLRIVPSKCRSLHATQFSSCQSPSINLLERLDPSDLV